MKTVTLLSGGIDSTVLLASLVGSGGEVAALSVDYGQRHRRELVHAQRIANQFGVRWSVADLSGITHLIRSSSQTSQEISVPHGHYAEESMKQTVVPNRNMIMLAVAAGWAIDLRFDRVAYAAHAGDRAIYPDCRSEFVDAMRASLGLCHDRPVGLCTPFVSMSKAGIVSLGAELGVDFSATWSCYEGVEVHCGRCGTCFERREAFALAGVTDPTDYAS